MTNTQSEKEIRASMASWAQALSEKDVNAMHQDYANSYKLFDVKATVDSVEGAKELWTECFPYFDKPKIEYKDLVIEATNDMAVVHFRSRITGMAGPVPEEMANSWLRGTCCFKKIDNSWKIFHEHISFPVDCTENKIVFEKLEES